jgi:alpha-tubulin suppressor-like RCC1 family protein
MPKLRRIALCTIAAAALSVTACGEEFLASNPRTVSVAPAAGFPGTLPHTDTSTLQVRVIDQSQKPLADATVRWFSSDSGIVQVVQDTAPTGSSFAEIAAAGLRARAIGRKRGTATISVVLSGGTGTADTTGYRTSITVLERWTTVSAGQRSTCAINIDGEVFCWGQDAGLLGNGSFWGSSVPLRALLPSDVSFSEVSVGNSAACAVITGRIAFCWGPNFYGEVGDGTLNPHFTPTVGGRGALFQNLSVGNYQACGFMRLNELESGNMLRCWGRSDMGQLGEGPDTASSVDCAIYTVSGHPIPQAKCVLGPPPPYDRFGINIFPLSLSAGGTHTCAISQTQSAYCWGLAESGQIGSTAVGESCDVFGYPPLNCFTTPTMVEGLPAVSSISAGWISGVHLGHSCAIAMDNQAFCWGSNTSGELGTDYADAVKCDDSGYLVPCARTAVPVKSATGFSQIGAGGLHTCAISELDSLVYCWGDDSRGQLGDGSQGGSRWQPGQVANSSLRFVLLSVGGYHTCGITAPDGALYCWGEGQALGMPGTYLSTPSRVPEPGP